MSVLLAAWFAGAGLAQAAETPGVRWGISGGFESVTNDPFLHRYGARLGGTVSPAPWLEVGLSGIYFPILGKFGHGTTDPDFKKSAPIFACDCTYDISLIDAEGQAVARVRVLSWDDGAWGLAFGAYAGVALVHTDENPQVLQVPEDDPDFAATARQWHPGPTAGLYWDAHTKRFGVRVRFEEIQYIETINSGTLESKMPTVLGAEVIKWF